jgi:hypothetical protein
MSTRASPRWRARFAQRATLLKRQKPQGVAREAWCPGGRIAAKALFPLKGHGNRVFNSIKKIYLGFPKYLLFISLNYFPLLEIILYSFQKNNILVYFLEFGF